MALLQHPKLLSIDGGSFSRSAGMLALEILDTTPAHLLNEERTDLSPAALDFLKKQVGKESKIGFHRFSNCTLVIANAVRFGISNDELAFIGEVFVGKSEMPSANRPTAPAAKKEPAPSM